MKATFIFLILFFCCVCMAFSQKTHVIDWMNGSTVELEINVGDTVKWVAADNMVVDVLSANAPSDFGSNTLTKRGSYYEYVFTKSGDVDFYSSTNPLSTRGKLVVKDPNAIVAQDFSFKLYPNPVKDRIYFEDQKKSKSFDVTFYDLLGKIVKRDRLSSITVRNGMDVSGLKRGVYLVQVENGSKTFTQKLIKN